MSKLREHIRKAHRGPIKTRKIPNRTTESIKTLNPIQHDRVLRSATKRLKEKEEGDKKTEEVKRVTPGASDDTFKEKNLVKQTDENNNNDECGTPDGHRYSSQEKRKAERITDKSNNYSNSGTSEGYSNQENKEKAWAWQKRQT